MPQKQYLSLDPNAGDAPSKTYLSTDPSDGIDTQAGITTGPNPETWTEMFKRNVGDFSDAMLSPIKGLHSLYKDPAGTMQAVGQGLAENINKSVAPDAVEKRGQEPPHSFGHDLGIVGSLAATQLPAWRILKAAGAGVRGGAGDVPILGRDGVAGGIRKSWANSRPGGQPGPAVSLKEGERIMGPSTMPGGPQGGTRPARILPPEEASLVEPFNPNTSGYKAGEVLDEGAGGIQHPTPPARSTFDDRLGAELRAEMEKPVVEPVGDLPPGRTITPGGRPSLTAGEYGEIADSAAGSVERDAAGVNQPTAFDRETLAEIAKENAAKKAAAEAAKNKAKPAESAGTATEEPPSDTERMLRDSLAAESTPGGPNVARAMSDIDGSRDAARILRTTPEAVKSARGDSVSAFPERARASVDDGLKKLLERHASHAELRAYIHDTHGNALSRSHIEESLKRGGTMDEATIADLMKR